MHFPVALFIMLFKVVLTFDSVDEIMKCDHSNESYWAVLSCGTVYYVVHDVSNFWLCGWNPGVWPFKWKLLSSTFLWHCLICHTRWFYILSLWMKSCGVAIQTQPPLHSWAVLGKYYFSRCLYDHLTNDVIIFLKLTSNSDVRWRFHFSCVVRCYASIVSRCPDFWNKQRLTVATACFHDEFAIASPTDVRFWIAFCRAV